MIEHKTNSDIRISNTKSLIHLLFRTGQMTKQELALQLGISQPTVATIIKSLEAKGLVCDGEIMGSTGGRKPLCHMPVYDAKYSIGVESARRQVKIVMLDLGSNKVAAEDYEVVRDYSPEYWRSINSMINEFIEKNNVDRGKILNVGITIDEMMKDGEVVSFIDNGCPLDIEEASQYFDYGVTFENSAKMAAIAQIWTNEERENYLYINIGSNIRGAMVYNDQVLDFSEINCEFGNMAIVDPKTGKLFKMAEELSVKSLLDKVGLNHVEDLLKKIDEGDTQCCQQIEDYLRKISIFLFNMHMVFGWTLIIGGRIYRLLERYKDKVDGYISEMSVIEGDTASVFELSKQGDDSAVIGAALLPIDEFLSQI